MGSQTRFFVSLTYGRLRLSSRWGCSDSKASNWQYIENIRLERRSNQGCHRTSRKKAGKLDSEKKEVHSNDMKMSIAQKLAQARGS